MAKRFLLIANPASGSPPRATLRDQALAGLRAAGAQVDLQVTLSAGHSFEIAREHELAGYDALCVLGGDGTMHEAVSGLLQRPQPLHIPAGLIPAGTGNSLGLSLGITDVAEAVRRIVAGKPRAVDVVRATAAGETHFCLNLIGWAAGQAINATAERLRWLGATRYAAAALWQVLSARPRRAKIVLDGAVHEDEFLLVLACNSKYVGSRMLAAPRAAIDDGLVDVVIVRRASRLRMLSLVQRVHDGSHVEMPEVEYHQVRSLNIETASPEPLNVDGEMKGTTPLAAEVLPGAIQLLA